MDATAEAILPAEEGAAATTTAPVAAPAKPPVTIDTRITQFIRLRDKIEAANEAHKKAMKPLNDALVALNADILSRLLQTGVDSVSVREVGTAYINTKKSATIADPTEFKRFVIGAQAFDLIDWRANAPAVAAYIEAGSEPPPGINYRVTQVVGVRRA